MKVHYINIFLFALQLNILVNTHQKPFITHHTPNIPTTRSLCECELYMPNYDNDPQMKKIMENFYKQTQQRFHEYDERMVEKRMQCKDKYDKEVQKIILKDKIEKQMAQQFATLRTDIQSDAIPTCVCEKSMADKTEKFCLNCGKYMGAVAPGWSLVSGLGYAAWTNYVTQTAIQKGIEAGVKWGIQELKDFFDLGKLIEVSKIKNLINSSNYADSITYFTFTENVKNSMCENGLNTRYTFCKYASYRGTEALSQRAVQIADNAKYSAQLAEEKVLNAAAPVSNASTTTITASVVAIVVIVLIMVIIYLILRYRRKKKMKKKLQYIKLLEE